MKYKTTSNEYKTIRINYPSELNHECILCKEKVKFQYSDNGKLVHTLHGIINQVTNLYSCTSSKCKLNSEVINPAPRYDYSQRHYGADVFRFITEEYLVYKSKSVQIFERLQRKYSLKISEQTVDRICDDILLLKSHKIDEKTFEIIDKQGYILLGLDGQDPGCNGPSIWVFTDIISGRILATRKLDSVNFEILHTIVEEILKMYEVKCIGWVSDKQGAITKCHDVYYPDLPHQYCQYHFLRNTWDHLAALDSNIYMPLSKSINGLYIHKASKTDKVNFENIGKVSVREVFKNTDKDLQTMKTVRNKTLKELRGIWLFNKLSEYVAKMDDIIEDLEPFFRFTKILSRTIEDLKKSLQDAKPYVEDVTILQKNFQAIRKVLGKDETTKEEKINALGIIYDGVLAEAIKKNPNFDFKDCKSFQPNKRKASLDVMGEWCRLWNSYKPGLFQYTNFPEKIKTNMFVEQGFSKQKQSIFSRVGKGNVSHIVSTRGEDILRLKHCTKEELETDIVKEYSDELVIQLRGKLRDNIKEQTEKWRTKSKQYKGINLDVTKYHCRKEKN